MIEIENLLFDYPGATFRLRVPRLHIGPNEQVAIVGPSGCGKTTLLQIIAGILPLAAGTVQIDGQYVNALNDRDRRQFRIQQIGLVFQEFELIDYLNVRDNILLPYRINTGLELNPTVRERLTALADSVGIDDKLDRKVNCLSQGERQRVAICRALLPSPKLLLADEPTGNLDPANKHRILQVLSQQAIASSASLIVVTHDHSLLDGFERVIDMSAMLESTAGIGGEPAARRPGETEPKTLPSVERAE